jgi:DNA-binding NarL/FixJ family response regulator
MKGSHIATMDLVTVLIADAHALLRKRLGSFLVQQQGIQVIGEAMNGRQVLRRVKALQPHILLLGLRMPNMNSLEVLPKIRARSPRTKILVLAEHFEEDFITKALQGGMHGCVLKTARPTELVKVIRTIHAGEFWVQRRLLTQVVESLRLKVDELQRATWKLQGFLSEREEEVVIWAVQGMTNKEIAAQLGISAKTVKTHLQNVFRKLNVRRRVQLSALVPHFTSHSSPAAPESPPSE